MTIPEIAPLLVLLGFSGSFLSGLVGIGGAIVMIPLLLTVPQLVGFAPLGIRTIAGMEIVQVVAGSLAGMAGHARKGAVDRNLVTWLGGSMVAGSTVGSLASAILAPKVMELTFACVTLVAATLIIRGRHRLPPEETSRPEPPRLRMAVIGAGVGTVAGMLGAGGAFLLVPLMLHVLKIPMRTVVGSSLGIVFVSAIAGLVGKAVTGQVVWELAAFLVLGGVPGGLLGARVSHRTTPSRLAMILGIILVVVVVRMWAGVLFGTAV